MAVTGNNTFTAFSRQVANRNFLSPAGFKFNLAKTPKVDFFSQSVSIPNINLGVSIQTSYLKDIPVPGDKMDYGDLDIEFFIDENLENYLQIERWMRSLGFPETVAESIPLDPNNDDLLMACATALYVRDTALRLRQQGMDLARAQLSSFQNLNAKNKGVMKSVGNQQNNPYIIDNGREKEDISWLL